MGQLRHFFTPLHQKTTRHYLDRMIDQKVECMKIAKAYEYDYWDGDRRYGYGGYQYDGRWKNTALEIISTYNLTNQSKILDIACGKAHLIHEIKLILPNIEIHAFDRSAHAIATAPEAIRENLQTRMAQNLPYPWPDKYFDLVLSLGCIHNLKIFELAAVLPEIERLGKKHYVLTESYRNETELFNLQCWALTCESFFDIDEWVWIFNEFGYTGDYEFIFFN